MDLDISKWNAVVVKIRYQMRAVTSKSTELVQNGVLRFDDGTSDPQKEVRTKCPLFTGSTEGCQCHWNEQLGVRAMNHQFLNVLATMQCQS